MTYEKSKIDSIMDICENMQILMKNYSIKLSSNFKYIFKNFFSLYLYPVDEHTAYQNAANPPFRLFMGFFVNFTLEQIFRNIVRCAKIF